MRSCWQCHYSEFICGRRSGGMLVNTTGHCTSRRLARANANSTGSYTTQRDVSRLLQTQQVCSAKARAVRSATSQQQASTSSSSCPGRLLAAGHIGPVCIPSCKASPSRQTRACAATMAAVAIPANFEAVMAVVAASFFVHHIFMAFSVGSARRKCVTSLPSLSPVLPRNVCACAGALLITPVRPTMGRTLLMLERFHALYSFMDTRIRRATASLFLQVWREVPGLVRNQRQLPEGRGRKSV